jgi:large conductance mechanosensitive channel
LGKGFRDFILRGTVVELAVAVVLGSAFTKLIESATAVSVRQNGKALSV